MWLGSVHGGEPFLSLYVIPLHSAFIVSNPFSSNERILNVYMLLLIQNNLTLPNFSERNILAI